MVLKREFPRPDAALAAARALVRIGRREEALRIMRQMDTKGSPRQREQIQSLSRVFVSDETFRLVQEGLNLISLERVPEAIQKFDAALANEPGNVEVLVRKAQAQFLVGQAGAAIETLKLANQINPWQPEITLWLGRCHLTRGETEEAIQELSRAATQLPKSELSAAWYAEALAVNGKWGPALDVLATFLKTVPHSPIVQSQRIELLLDSGDSNLANPARLKAVRKDLDLLLKSDSIEYGAEEGELGIRIYTPSKLRKKLEANLADLDRAIEATSVR